MNDPLLYFHTEPDPQFRERKLTPVMSGQVRQLTGKMLIPSSRIRLMDTLGHGKIAVYLAWKQKMKLYVHLCVEYLAIVSFLSYGCSYFFEW